MEGMRVKIYSVDEAFLILQHNKITSHKESVKRWLRQGKLLGQKGGGPKKNGWIIQEEDLHAFIKERVPEGLYLPMNPLPIENPSGNTEEMEFYREEGRLEMWQQITSRNIWEGRHEFKKRFIQDCMDHLRLDNKNLRDYLFENILSHNNGYAKPGVSYLLEKFRFNGHRLDFYLQYGSLEEQITFSVIDYLRGEYKKKVTE
jgi:hypothetical protein